MKFLTLIAAGAICGLVVSAVAAQNPKGPAAKTPMPNKPGQQFGQPFNPGVGAGAANQAAVREAMMKRFDRDGDGKLSPQEQLAATKALQEHGVRTPGAPNLIGPGKSNGVQAGPGIGQVPAPPAPKLGRREELLLKRFDKDGDGKLNDEEKAAARAELSQKNKAENKAEKK